jgi:hypothetical protein
MSPDLSWREQERGKRALQASTPQIVWIAVINLAAAAPPSQLAKNGSKNKLLDVNVSLGMLYSRGILLTDLFLQ